MVYAVFLALGLTQQFQFFCRHLQDVNVSDKFQLRLLTKCSIRFQTGSKISKIEPNHP